MKITWTNLAAAMIAAVTILPLGCGSVVAIGGQPPGCPASAPAANSACSAAATGCTYDAGPCVVEASCDPKVGAWQSETTSCFPAAKECWSAAEGDVCAVVGDSCGEGSGPCDASFFNTCGDDHHWHASGSPGGGTDCCPLTGTCPATAPNEGDACDPCYGAPSCGYADTCGGSYATCGGDGQWHVAIGECPPPPPPDFCTSHGDQGGCEADTSCRWLTPGCGDSPIWAAGCFTINDCGPGSCDPSQICQTFSYDPCFGKKCDACGAPALLCIGGL